MLDPQDGILSYDDKDDRVYPEDRAEELRQEYLAIQHAIGTMQDRLDEIKAEVRSLLPRGTHEVGDGGRVTISPNHRFDEELARKAIPGPMLPLVLREVPAHMQIDRFACKSELPRALYEKCMKRQGEDKVSFA
jgi:hypothetical protein